MCTTNIYTYIHPDGRREQYTKPTFCSNSRHGQVCSANYRFEHPAQYVSAYDASAAYPYPAQLPPTPQYSPAPSTPSGSYRSGDESDRSYSSSSSKKERSSGVYINGTKVLDLNRKRRGSRHQERIVLVDSPPTPRTPPQQWSAPASPNANTYMIDSSRDPNHRRPVIVDERTLQPDSRRVQIEVVDNHSHHHRSKHHRHASSSSKDSRHSNEDEERRRRHEKKRLQEKEERLQRRIAEANAEIAGRPVALAPSAPKRSSTYKRPSVEIPVPVDDMRRLSFEEERRDVKARRIARREEKKEEEAQRERLLQRIQPKRRLTIGAESRRPSELYDPRVYRYE